MSNYRRVFVEGGTYFFTVVLENRQSDLLCQYIHEFRQAYAETLSFYTFETIAICVLPDHFHWVVKLSENEKNYPKILHALKYNFTKRLPENYKNPNQSKMDKQEFGVWQRRYWEHCVRDDLDLERHVFYTYFNPVKHGLVKSVKDWAFSSFHRDVKLGLLPLDWGDFSDNEWKNLYRD